ncbi:tripartite tricarboxylate transporter TctB family protein [uncultured Cohaesibacter sp.]|uniref:tripartite tricarboxylate transporter TctB family protein n=1 Tax=uncultured Cohaesibacter sp. TaxID=1002546 RepID=UPI00292FBB32|nr:tripartite tricarboxylate transporter TctB family protein [uncultured Cohaesibacter sp.]
MRISQIDKLFSALLFFLGLYVIVKGMQYGLWIRGVPGPGFFPLLSGLMMSILSSVTFLKQIRRTPVSAVEAENSEIKGELDKRTLLAIAGVIVTLSGFILLSPYLGMTLAGFFLIFAIGLLTQPEEQKGKAFLVKLTVISLGTIIGCNLLFRFVLGVPVLTGPFGL